MNGELTLTHEGLVEEMLDQQTKLLRSIRGMIQFFVVVYLVSLLLLYVVAVFL